MGAGQGKTRRAQATASGTSIADAVVFDLKRAVTADKSGLAKEIMNAFREQNTTESKITAVISNETATADEETKAMAYTITCSALDGIKVTNMSVDGRWNLGTQFTLQENGKWSAKAFSYDPKNQKKINSRSKNGTTVGDKYLANMKQNVEKITTAQEWGVAKTVGEIVHDLSVQDEQKEALQKRTSQKVSF